MNVEKIQKELYEKMQKEFSEFIQQLKQKSIDDVLEKSYEKTIKELLMMLFEPSISNFEFDEIGFLNQCDCPLEALYQGWMDNDRGIYEVLEDTISLTINYLKELQNEMNGEKRIAINGHGEFCSSNDFHTSKEVIFIDPEQCKNSN